MTGKGWARVLLLLLVLLVVATGQAFALPPAGGADRLELRLEPEPAAVDPSG